MPAMAARDDPVASTTPAKTNGPRMPANFSNTEKKPKNSEERCGGTKLANSERDSACVPPCTIATRTPRTTKPVAVCTK